MDQNVPRMCIWQEVLDLRFDRGPLVRDFTMALASGSVGDARGRTATGGFRATCPVLGKVFGLT
jgi:hypothetical protein